MNERPGEEDCYNARHVTATDTIIDAHRTTDIGPAAPPAPVRIPIVLGVIGHRDYRPTDEKELRTALADIFRAFRAAFPHAPLRLLSSLAEGADQLGVKVADELNRSEGLGIELQFPLPFPVEIYAESSTFGHGPDKQQLESEADAETFMKDRVTQAGEGAFVVPLDYPIDQTPWKELRTIPPVGAAVTATLLPMLPATAMP